MKGLKYTILPHGFIENDLAWNVAMPIPHVFGTNLSPY